MKSIFKLFKKDDTLIRNIKRAFSKIKEELDDHLDAVNQNTSDIHDVYNILGELEAKIDKMSERLDELDSAVNPKKARTNDIKLTPREQEVFMALYLNKSLRLIDVSKKLGFTQDMVNLYLFNLISKGIPIQKELCDDVLVFSLDPDFKDLQARRNVLEIDPRIGKQLVKDA